MARVAVNVVIKPEILDPQGKAILAAFARTDQQGVTSVRQGKHFELEVDDSVSDADLEELAATVLANPVIENWSVHRLGADEQFVTEGDRVGGSQPRSEERVQGRGPDRAWSRAEDTEGDREVGGSQPRSEERVQGRGPDRAWSRAEDTEGDSEVGGSQPRSEERVQGRGPDRAWSRAEDIEGDTDGVSQ